MTASTPQNKLSEFERLVEIMKALRDPVSGCPWDLEQNFSTIAPYTVEEAYEVADAIERNDFNDLKSELGDLLLQVVFHSQMAYEQNLFSIEDVAKSINDKMVSRHPHVFGDVSIEDSDAQTKAWEDIKATERAAKSGDAADSALADVAVALPALLRAQKLQKRAARVGFDWPTPDSVFDKLDEEIGEVKDAIREGDQAHIEEELGDLLFVCANLVRKLGAESEDVLKAANKKFTTRFMAMEALARLEGNVFAELSLDEQEALWQRVKRA